eukprot:767230-Hanusia_phi.AAC.10
MDHRYSPIAPVPSTAVCTIDCPVAAELREIINLQGINTHILSEEIKLDEVDAEVCFDSYSPPPPRPDGWQMVAKKRPTKRMVELVQQTASKPKTAGANKVLPDEKNPSRLGAIELRKNVLEGPADKRKAVPTDSTKLLPCSMLLRSVGYKSLPMEGAPFDSKVPPIVSCTLCSSSPSQSHIVPNDGGHVEPGLYVSG